MARGREGESLPAVAVIGFGGGTRENRANRRKLGACFGEAMLAESDLSAGETDAGAPVGIARERGDLAGIDPIEIARGFRQLPERDEAVGKWQQRRLGEGMARAKTANCRAVGLARALQPLGEMVGAALGDGSVRKRGDGVERERPLLGDRDAVDGEVVAGGIVEASQAAFGLGAGGQQLHGQLMIGPEGADKIGVHGAGFGHRGGELALNHVGLGEIEAHAQDVATGRSLLEGIGGDELAGEALGGGAVTEANVGEGEALLQIEARGLIELGQGCGFIGSLLEKMVGREGIALDESQHTLGRVQAHEEIRARRREMLQQTLLLGDEGAGAFEALGLEGTGFHGGTLELGGDGILRIGATDGQKQPVGAFVLAARLGKIAAAIEGLGNGQVEAGGGERVGSELAIDAGRGIMDGGGEGLGGLPALKRVAAAEQVVGEECVHRGGNGGLAIGGVALGLEAEREVDDETGNREHDRRGGGDRAAATLQKSAQTVGQRIGTGLEWFAVQKMVYIAH